MSVINLAAGSQPGPGSDPLTLLKASCQETFSSLLFTTQACHGVLNTVVIAPTPKPLWFDNLQSKLDDAKVVATDWVTNIAPGVTGGVPVRVINYGLTYSALAEELRSIAAAYPDARGADDLHIGRAQGIVAVLPESLQAVLSGCIADAASLTRWGEQLQAARDALNEAVDYDPEEEAHVAGACAVMDQAVRSVTVAVGDIRDSAGAWADIEAELSEVSLQLRSAVIGLGAIVESGFGQAVAQQWTDLVMFAENLAGGPLPAPVGPAVQQNA